MKTLYPAVIVFGVSIASLSLGNILLKISMERFSALTGAGVPAMLALERVPQLPLGIGLMILQFFCTITLFKWGWDVSTVIPIMGLSYVAMGILGKWMLGEPVSAMRWFGILLIVLGVFFVARSVAPGKAA